MNCVSLTKDDRSFIASMTGNAVPTVDEFVFGLHIDDEAISARQLRQMLDAIKVNIDPRWASVDLVRSAYKKWISELGYDVWTNKLLGRGAVTRIKRLSKVHPEIRERFDPYQEYEVVSDGPSKNAEVAIMTERHGELESDHKVTDGSMEQVDWKGFHVSYLRVQGEVAKNDAGYPMMNVMISWADTPTGDFKILPRLIEAQSYGAKKAVLIRILRGYLKKMGSRDESIKTVQFNNFWYYTWTWSGKLLGKDVTFTCFSKMRLEDLKEETREVIESRMRDARAFKEGMDDALGF